MPSIQINEKFANQRYLILKRIGVGGYSQVWLAEDTKAGNLEIALKIFAPEKGLDSKGLEVFSKEYSLVFNLNHKNLLIPKHFDEFENSPYLVLPYCRHGSVFGKIGEMNEQELARFMQQASSALNYLHNQDPPIIHQDIKPDNFLIDGNGNYLLADFGISSKIRRTLTKSMGAQASTGTLAYMPPEKFSADKQIIKAGDVFSLGVTMYELLTGDLPFGDNGGLTLKAGAEVPNLPGNFSPELNSLLRSCMSKEPWERPTAEQLEEVAVIFLQTGQWSVVGNGAAKPAPEPPKEPKQPRGGRKTQPIPQPQPQPQPKSQSPPKPGKDKGKTPPAKKRNLTPWIIAAAVIVIGIVVCIVWFGSKGLTVGSKGKPDSTDINFEMVFVNGGSFYRGSNDGEADEKPVHLVMLGDFYIGKYEVTQKQWREVMGNNPSNFSGCDDCPVENVSWDDVQEFIQKLNQKTGKSYRLPTEAEWEYAARGGNKSSGYIYSGSNIVDDVAWYNEDSSSKTHPVGQKQPNDLCLYDMSGNVWEWCSDWYGSDYYQSSPTSNPQGPSSGSYRVYRGGSWFSQAACCIPGYRFRLTPGYHLNSLGFRLAFVP
ncbi:MAG: bifunctional serine/threonine-protein kinase/formylglycine-generating enzyme family protein [Bacteroidetes bacterium]|nr:bifunctional serine/threonine-protein kinase/formylglycine-generating enzyme family protein [Bacteroidota bacterium]